MTTCSDVTTCLSEGSTECTPASETCPPCVYVLTGGDYSCYYRDTNGECPFPDSFAECDKSASTSTSKNKTSNSSDSPSKAPMKAPSATTPETPASDTTGSTISQATSNDNTLTTRATSSSITTTTPSSSDTTQSSKVAPDSASDSGSVPTLMSNTTATPSSPVVVNMALIGGAVVLVGIIIVFIARRAKKKEKKVDTMNRTVSTRDSHQSDETLSSGASSANVYSTYHYPIEKGSDNGISMLSDSQASSIYDPEYDDQIIHSGPSSRPTADFSNYGDAENMQYYSVSTGPGVVASGQHQYVNNGMPPPSAQAGNHFVDVTTSSRNNRHSELNSARSEQYPLTVSQLMPTAIGEHDEEAYASRQKPGSLLYGHVQPRVFESGVLRSNTQPQVFGVSTASSMRSDYDIVDPITMRGVETRNTEMLAKDNRYPKFSFESEVGIYDGSSSEEEGSDDEQVRHMGEHTI